MRMRSVSVSGKRVYVGLHVCIKLYVLHPCILFIVSFEFFSAHCQDTSLTVSESVISLFLFSCFVISFHLYYSW